WPVFTLPGAGRITCVRSSSGSSTVSRSTVSFVGIRKYSGAFHHRSPPPARRGQDNVLQELVGLEHVLALHVLLRRHREVVGRLHHPLASRPHQTECRVVRDKRHGETRRGDGVAGSGGEAGG